MRSLSLSDYASHFGLDSNERNHLSRIMADQTGLEEAIAGSLDDWDETIVPRVGHNALGVFLLRTRIYLKAICCTEKCGLSSRLGAALAQILADTTENVIRLQVEMGGGTDE